MTPTITFIPCT